LRTHGIPEVPVSDLILARRMLAFAFAIWCNTLALSERFASFRIPSPMGFRSTVESTGFLIALAVNVNAIPISFWAMCDALLPIVVQRLLHAQQPLFESILIAGLGRIAPIKRR
jgi:hypothetical protein